jgi:hypothetical protein
MPEEQNEASPDLVTAFCNFFRAITRPAVTIIFAAVIAQVVIDKIDAPQWFLGLAAACILWWFGDRTVRHIKESKTSLSTGVPIKSGKVKVQHEL